jgi:hypothetical protein
LTIGRDCTQKKQTRSHQMRLADLHQWHSSVRGEKRALPKIPEMRALRCFLKTVTRRTRLEATVGFEIIMGMMILCDAGYGRTVLCTPAEGLNAMTSCAGRLTIFAGVLPQEVASSPPL